MSTRKSGFWMAFALAGMVVVLISGCKKDEPFATVKITATGTDLGGDVTGDGGSTTQTYTWNNPAATANWNMDITASSGGSFQLIIKDADGKVVLDNTLTKGSGDDSASGVTAAGNPGDWKVTVVLTAFNGDGSFSISPGD